MRIVAGGSARNEFQETCPLHLVHARTTRPPFGLRSSFGMMVSGVFRGHIRGHFMAGAHVAGVHGHHRSHRHFGPGRYDEE